jgi:hypothetical protein
MRRLDRFFRYGGIRVIRKDASNKEMYREVVAAVSLASRPNWLGDNNCPVRKEVS